MGSTRPSAESTHPLRVAVTRPTPDPRFRQDRRPDRLSTLLRARGFHPIHFPVTRILPPGDDEPLNRAAREIARYDWVVVTSARAVAPLVEAMERQGTWQAGRRSRSGTSRAGTSEGGGGIRRCCAVGPRTAAALSSAGISVDLVPDRFVAEGVVEALLSMARPESGTLADSGERAGGDALAGGGALAGAGPLAGARILVPRAQEARDLIPRELRAVGAEVDVVAAYRTEADAGEAMKLAAAVRRDELDVLTFAAGSAASSFAAAWRKGPEEGVAAPDAPIAVPETPIAAIGPATAAVLEKEGMPARRVADPHTFEGLVAAVAELAAEGSR